jgi:hypothetical protein
MEAEYLLMEKLDEQDEAEYLRMEELVSSTSRSSSVSARMRRSTWSTWKEFLDRYTSRYLEESP